MAVAGSQADGRPALRLRKGAALLDAGDAPAAFHLETDGRHVLIDGLTGLLHLAREGESLSVTPIGGAALVDTSAGGQVSLAPGRRLRLSAVGKDLLEDADAPDLAAFERPAPPKALSPAPLPDPRRPTAVLGASSYRFVSRGRWIREGVWSPETGLLSAIGDLAGYRAPGDAVASVLRRRASGWGEPGSLRGAESAAAETLRSAQPPHVLLDLALACVRGEPAARETPDGPELVWDFDPARIRAEMGLLVERAFAEGRLERPATVRWETLEGRLQVALTADGRVRRIEDRRGVDVDPALGNRPRFRYQLETVTTLDEHGRAAFRPPGR